MEDLDKLLVEVKFAFKNGNINTIKTTASQSCDFVDWLNELMDLNKYNKLSKDELKRFSNNYYIFDDYEKKTTISVNTESLIYFEIPWFSTNGEEPYRMKYQF